MHSANYNQMELGPSLKQFQSARTSVFKPGARFRSWANDPGAWPWHAIARIVFAANGRMRGVGTGFVIASDMILTARHCFRDSAPTAIDVVLGCDFEHRLGTSLEVLGHAWHHPYDMAVIRARIPPGIRPISLATIEPQRVTVAGYPALSGRLEVGEGAMRRIGPVHLYDVTMVEGDSGSPVLAKTTDGYALVSMHLGSKVDPRPGVPDAKSGYGPVITPEFIAALGQIQTLVRHQGGS